MASGSWCSMTGSSPCERGKIGSLYIGGVGLSPGYWNDPAKTEEVFHPSQPGADSSDRIYKTGDLARIGDDGLIYLVGRADSQVKIRGFRIESERSRRRFTRCPECRMPR